MIFIIVFIFFLPAGQAQAYINGGYVNGINGVVDVNQINVVHQQHQQHQHPQHPQQQQQQQGNLINMCEYEYFNGSCESSHFF